jgi:DNA-directed RNA polymerase specialized sigma24 family protein
MRTEARGGATAIRGPDDLDEAQLAAYAQRLLAHVRWRAKRLLGWLHTNGTDLALGVSCQDIMQEALASLYGPPQPWDPIACPDPWDHLVSVANSKIVGLQQKLRRRAVHGEKVAHDGELSEADEKGILPPDEAFGFHDEVLAAIIDDDQLVQLFDLAVKDGELFPQDVAAKLGIPVREVDNVKKRLRRRVNEVRVKLGMKPL